MKRLLSFAVRLVVPLLAAGPVHANHGPKWVELASEELRAVAVDTDGDGIFDAREALLGTDPQRADSDRDGFGDLLEDGLRAFGFDPLEPNRDRDRDGLADRLERVLGTSPADRDSDGDGLADFDEVMNRRFGYDPLKRTSDRDFDGLSDRLERRLGTSSTEADSNHDGVSDFAAYYEGIHPRQPLARHPGETVGTAYSRRMAEAIARMRAGAGFPPELAAELPYPAVTRRLYGNRLPDDGPGLPQPAAPSTLSPSAALLQSGLSAAQDIFYVTALYPTYNQLVGQLKQIALAFNGSSRPDIARLFYWSETTDGHRRIYALKISDHPELNEGEPEILVMALHHARELISATYAMELVRDLTEGYAAGDPAVVSRVDGSEIWLIPVVNPDGYAMAQSELAQGANVNWRKNTRKVFELSTSGAAQSDATRGVDPNRNYDFDHIRTLSTAQRTALPGSTCVNNGLTGIGHPTLFPCEGFETSSSTYAGFAFSDVESRSVRMLADDQFASGHEIDGIRCSLSWHTGGVAAIIAPFDHDAYLTVSPSDRIKLDHLGNAYAAATGFAYYPGNWWAFAPNYQAFGTSDDWLYVHDGILALTVEGYPRTVGPYFFPEDAQTKQSNVALNVTGALAFMDACAPLRVRRARAGVN